MVASLEGYPAMVKATAAALPSTWQLEKTRSRPAILSSNSLREIAGWGEGKPLSVGTFVLKLAPTKRRFFSVLFSNFARVLFTPRC